jgi:hypothetical protein
MRNLDQVLQKIANGCLLYVVNTQTGELLPMNQNEYQLAQRRQHCLIPHTDPTLANLRSLLIRAGLRRWELAS